MEPCGYCRRCAIHDDPGGCLEVERWERDNPALAIAAIQAANPRPFEPWIADAIAELQTLIPIYDLVS